MAPSRPTIARMAVRADQEASHSSNGPSGILIAGISIISVCVLVILFGIAFRYMKKNRERGRSQSDVDKTSTDTEKPPPAYGFSRAQITASLVLPTPARIVVTSPRSPTPEDNGAVTAHSRNLSHAEKAIVAAHSANHELPAPFAPFVYNFGSDPQVSEAPNTESPDKKDHSPSPFPDDATGRDRLSVASTYSITVSIGRTGAEPGSRSSYASFAPSPLRAGFHQQTPSSISIDSDSNRGSFVSAQSGNATVGGQSPRTFRFPFPPQTHSRGVSAASTRSAAIFANNATSAMRKKALQPFTPLLEDELAVSVGDTLSLLQDFDDGWCVCAQETSPGDSSADTDHEIRMGCVPLWVFERKSSDGPPAREMRSTSLAITVDIAPNGPGNGLGLPAKPWEREHVVSWSNF